MKVEIYDCLPPDSKVTKITYTNILSIVKGFDSPWMIGKVGSDKIVIGIHKFDEENKNKVYIYPEKGKYLKCALYYRDMANDEIDEDYYTYQEEIKLEDATMISTNLFALADEDDEKVIIAEEDGEFVTTMEF